MKASVDLLAFFGRALLSMLVTPQRLPGRSWRAELVCRISRRLLHASMERDVGWLRERQNLLRHYHPAQRKVRFESETIAGVPCQWCASPGANRDSPLVLYFHGGGFVIGNVAVYRPMLAALAVAGDCTLLGVDYRLAPEHPLPAAQEDCLAVCRAMLDRYPARPLILAGDSAGGSLCLSTLVALRDEGRTVAGSLLISPLCEPGATDPSMTRNEKTDLLSQPLTEHWASHATAGKPTPEQLSRLDFMSADLGSLPPLCIQSAEGEILFDQIERFAMRAKEQGVDVDYQPTPGQFHVFQIFAPLVPEANIAIGKLGSAIKAMTQRSI
ncbi:alpha/beta hydrolase [Aestuariirhabdus sp. LZHN29]|uniref:alpha/beta hydrolase n=1 Tax=Aestuariirhabdus sp. LZHN29 TaxID=3417462 RepID=UPI003CEB5037